MNETFPTSQVLSALAYGPGGAQRATRASARMAAFLNIPPGTVPERQWTRLELHDAHVLH